MRAPLPQMDQRCAHGQMVERRVDGSLSSGYLTAARLPVNAANSPLVGVVGRQERGTGQAREVRERTMGPNGGGLNARCPSPLHHEEGRRPLENTGAHCLLADTVSY